MNDDTWAFWYSYSRRLYLPGRASEVLENYAAPDKGNFADKAHQQYFEAVSLRTLRWTLISKASVIFHYQPGRLPSESNRLDSITFWKPPLSVEHLVYASSSSIWQQQQEGALTDDKVDNPVSLCCCWKSNELIRCTHTLSLQYPSTGLIPLLCEPAIHLIYVYFGFTNKLVNGETIKISSVTSNCKRDFTYVDDIAGRRCPCDGKSAWKKNGEDGLPFLPMQFITSAIATRRTCWTLCRFIGGAGVLVCCQTMISGTLSWFQCSLVMPGWPLQTRRNPWSRTYKPCYLPGSSASRIASRLLNGTKSFMAWGKGGSVCVVKERFWNMETGGINFCWHQLPCSQSRIHGTCDLSEMYTGRMVVS